LKTLFENEINKFTIFKDETKINLDYIPPKLLHREKEISYLWNHFKILISSPKLASPSVLITGKNGVGKTVLVKTFGIKIEKLAKIYNVKLKFIHINCKIEASAYQIILKLLESINISIPHRGFSFYELFDLLKNELEIRDQTLLITLDEIDSLKRKDYKLLYSLLKFNENKINSKHLISIIAISNDLKFINNIDGDIKGIFLTHNIKIKPFSQKELFDILKDRVNEAFFIGSVPDQIIKKISEWCAPKNDIKIALNILKTVGKIAEQSNSFNINSNFLNKAFQNFEKICVY